MLDPHALIKARDGSLKRLRAHRCALDALREAALESELAFDKQVACQAHFERCKTALAECGKGWS